MARIGRWVFCSFVLPWKGAQSEHPWVGDGHAEKTRHTVDALLPALPRSDLIWGGDWNHALAGREYAGSMAGRAFITEAAGRAGHPGAHRHLSRTALPGLLSIDHIGVPVELEVVGCWRHAAVGADGRRMSDHDAYVVEVSGSL